MGMLNGVATIEEIMAQTGNEYTYECLQCSDAEWPDSVHHQSWHDSWRDSH